MKMEKVRNRIRRSRNMRRDRGERRNRGRNRNMNKHNTTTTTTPMTIVKRPTNMSTITTTAGKMQKKN